MKMQFNPFKLFFLLMAMSLFVACGGSESGGDKDGEPTGEGTGPVESDNNGDSDTPADGENISSSGEKVQLGLNLEAGKTYRLMTNTSQEISQTIGGQSQDMTQTIGMGLKHTVESVDESGTATIDVIYEKVKYEQNGPLGRTTYDSDDPNADVPLMAKGFAALVDNGFKMMTNNKGEITDIQGVSQMLQKMVDGLGVSGAQAAQIESSLKMQFGDEALKQSMENTMAVYPSRPVGVGDSWTKTMEVNSGFPIKTTNTWTVKDIKDGVVYLNVVSKVSSADAGMEVAGMNVKYNLSGTQGGSIEMDQTTGWIKKSNLKQDISGRVEASNMDWPISIKSDIEVTEY